ncbi:armadillo-type protein [Epithele typhae]|uniref:armadillo-type protein n=1 Tax=Epithele typhae TaxID=378194 RepID=UPI00200837F0|nr:armadillo-type protein [Epithele typhae]KAH9941134.1 armadillo-type protein [Epithele typhae]
MVAQTRNAGQPSPKKLKFRDKILVKGVSTDALLKKLKQLHQELADMDQESADISSLAPIRKDLINTSILLHKDRGVKAYTACCLADLLRLYAPDAPYNQNELRDIFQFFFRQLSTGLKGADSAYYNEYFHLLESLSTVKSVVLVCDLPNGDELMVDIFRDFFGLVRRDLAKKIELFMADILIALIDECSALPSEVLEVIMAQFTDKNAKMEQPSYRLAVQVCNATSDKLQRHVCQYFTDIIVDRAREEEYDEVQVAHDLIQQLNRACPSLLHNVVPQLEEELRVEHVQLRVMATKTLGEMFSDKHGFDLTQKYHSTWQHWLGRRNDKSVLIRSIWVESMKGVIVSLPQVQRETEETLASKLLDPDDKIRAAVCKLYGELDYEVALHHVSVAQLQRVAGRGLDKKRAVRVEAFNAVGRLYGLAYPEIENNDPAAIEHFAWIPKELLKCASVSRDVKSLAEQVLEDHLLPLPLPPAASSSKGTDVDEVAWTDRLLLVSRHLDDEIAMNTLFSFTNLKGVRPTPFEKFVAVCIEYNGGIIDDDEDGVTEKLNAIIKEIAFHFTEPQKASEDLLAFAKLNEPRLYKLLKTCMDVQTDLKGLLKARIEFMRRLEQSSAIVPTMSAFLRRSSLHILGTSSIPTLIKRVAKGAEPPSSVAYSQTQNQNQSFSMFAAGSEPEGRAQKTAQVAQIWLTYVSKHCPALYKAHIGEFAKAVADERNARLVEVCLQALAAAATWDAKLAPNDKRTVDRVLRFVNDANERHAKFATQLVVRLKNSEALCEQLIESISEELPDVELDTLVAHIAVLAQLALRAPDAFEQRSDVIMAFLVKDVLRSLEDDSMDIDNSEWEPDERVSYEVRAKILALKVCRNRCLAHAGSESALEIAQPVIRMFSTVLFHDGSFTEAAMDTDRPTTKARMRLQAATALLKLSVVRSFAEEINKHFARIAITVQDRVYNVRMTFLLKLLGLLSRSKLPSHYNVTPFLCVHDPEEDIKDKAQAYVLYALHSMPKIVRLDRFEQNFIRLLHLLAHHPDFTVDAKGIPDMAKYIQFFLALVANNDNISLLYHISLKAKTVRDAESHTYSENLYVVAELAQHLIRTHAKAHSWTLETWPGKVRLPQDILRPLPSPEAGKQILKRVYLSDEALTWLAEKSKATAEPKERKPRAPRQPGVKRKAAGTKANGTSKRPRTARKRKDDESEEESDVSDPDDDDEDEERAATSPSKPPESGSSSEAEVEGDETKERPTRTRAQAKKQAKRAAKREARASG